MAARCPQRLVLKSTKKSPESDDSGDFLLIRLDGLAVNFLHVSDEVENFV